MALTSAMEDYLEAVLIMQQRHGYVRCVDVAEQLGVKKPSVSRAVKELSKSGHLVKNADGTLSLTELGLQLPDSLLKPGFPMILQRRTLVDLSMSLVN